MTRVYFSTVHRGADPNQSGEFVCLDWDAKQTVARVPVAAESDDPNPRGGTRGGRGMWATDSHVYAATHHAVWRMELDLTDRTLVASGPPLADIHEVTMDGDTLWCAATFAGAAVGVDVGSGAVRSLKREGRGRDILNGVALWEGCVHALLSARGAIVNMETQIVVTQSRGLVRSHSLVIEGDSAYVAATRSHEVMEISLPSGQLRRSLSLRALPWVSAIEQTVMGSRISSPLFARGLSVVGDRVFVGIGPASIVCIDWSGGRMVDAYQYSEDVDVAVHGLHVTEAG